MPAWLDMGIVSVALLLAAFGAWRLVRRKRAAACAPGCGACEPTEQKSELVQIGDRRSRSFLAGSRPNR